MAIEFEGLNQEFTTSRLSQGTATQATTSLERSALLSRVAWRFENAERQGRYSRLGNLVVETLDNRISDLESATSNFSWPVSGNSQRKARLVTPANASSDIKGLLRTELRSGDDAQRYYKYFSTGRNAATNTNLDGKDYRFSITQGDSTEKIDISIAEGQNWGEILDSVAEAVNQTSLPVQAEVIRQTGPYQDLDFLHKTGSILAVTVNAGHQDQDVSFRDLEGLLTTNLKLDATERPVAAPTIRTHNVASASPASASTYTTTPVNPIGDPGLTAGEHRLLFTVGDITNTVAVTVDNDMDWEELLENVANRINSTSTELSARVMDGEMSSGQLEPLSQRSIQLEVSLASPKRGDRLALSEYGGPWLDDIDGFHDPTNGLPNWVTGGERYIASATANGWTEGNVYEYDGSAWSETATVTNNAVSNMDDGQDWFNDGTSWSTTPSGNLVDSLGLNTTASPGQDAQAHINGRDMVSETGIFSLDQGRMTIEAQAPLGQNLPLKVESGYAEIQDRFTDMVTAYNGLRDFLLPNADLFEAGFPDTWRDPVSDLSTELEWMGVEELPGSGNLWVRSDDFAQALVQDSQRARATLFDAPGGLAPRLAQVSSTNRQPSLEDHLVHPKVLVDPGPAPATEADLSRQSQMQDVIAAGTDVPRPEQSPYVEFSNLMADIIRQGHEQMEALANMPDTGRIFDSES
ncbi:hypothetical protein [Desulfovibrio ferrophilus]|uniref:Uncharacterized protein n=1 Tax=Desulfovibrio ferrophilus TaxID=241368 RepID=A0A2Z6B2B5_9BACT|nr:hypothetical protein [Desulfovibrio ferrophilus]BBD09621.1 uncharacterized protein DFE_2895 [Desulfovibrio ferrophilus]